MIKKYTIVFLSLFLTSCSYLSVGPDYDSPELNLPGEFSTKAGKVETKAELPPAEWWKAFDDKVLNEIIVQGTDGNLSLKQAFERLNIARANASLSFQDFFPEINIFSGYQKTKSPTFRFPGSNSNSFKFQQYSLGGDASWEIDIFGRLRRLNESDEELKNQSLFLTADTLRLLQADLATYYIQLRAAQSQRKIAEANLKKQREVLNVIKQKLDVGESSALDYERTNALASSTEALIPQYKAAENSALYRLATLLGTYPSELPLSLKADAKIPKYIGPANISSPADVIKRRPDVRAAEASAKSDNALVGVSISNLFPIVNFTGSLSEEARSAKDWFNGSSDAYSIAPRLSWSIINVASIIQDIKRSRAKARIGIYAYKDTVLKALEESEAALSEVDSQLQRKISLKSAFKSARKVQELAQDQYNEGLIDNLSLIEAQQSALQNQSQLRDSQAQLALSYVRLFKALGGGWEEEPATESAKKEEPVAAVDLVVEPKTEPQITEAQKTEPQKTEQ